MLRCMCIYFPFGVKSPAIGWSAVVVNAMMVAPFNNGCTRYMSSSRFGQSRMALHNSRGYCLSAYVC